MKMFVQVSHAVDVKKLVAQGPWAVTVNKALEVESVIAVEKTGDGFRKLGEFEIWDAYVPEDFKPVERGKARTRLSLGEEIDMTKATLEEEVPSLRRGVGFSEKGPDTGV